MPTGMAMPLEQPRLLDYTDFHRSSISLKLRIRSEEGLPTLMVNKVADKIT